LVPLISSHSIDLPNAPTSFTKLYKPLTRPISNDEDMSVSEECDYSSDKRKPKGGKWVVQILIILRKLRKKERRAWYR